VNVSASRSISRSANTHINDVVDVIILNIMISFVVSNHCIVTLYVLLTVWFSLVGCYNCVFSIWFALLCFQYFVVIQKNYAFRLFLKNKSGALRLASLALPWCLTNANTNVKFQKKHKLFIVS
jgi:hypothetical protein